MDGEIRKDKRQDPILSPSSFQLQRRERLDDVASVMDRKFANAVLTMEPKW